eukprot:NODE_331_length_10750_cov_0.204676.p4 type:complete len:215 gc:universal NODE_331_length_10750_cov_0.204676:834-190(-)
MGLTHLTRRSSDLELLTFLKLGSISFYGLLLSRRMLQRFLRGKEVFFGQLPFNCTAKDLKELLPYSILNISLPVRDDNLNKGYAFIEFENEADAEKVMEEHSRSKFKLAGRELNLDFANSPKSKFSRFNRNRADIVPTKSLYVGSLPFNFLDESFLKSQFENAEKIQIFKNSSGSSLGFAVVNFKTIEDSESAFNEHSSLAINGRKTVLDYLQQ